MPELPEVETIRRGLSKKIIGKKRNLINQDAYDQLAEEYKKRDPITEKDVRFVLERFTRQLDQQSRISRSKKKVLDVGVGSGMALRILEEIGFCTYGIDISQEMLKIAHLSSPKSILYYKDVMEFDPKERYDGIDAQAFIHLFPKKEVKKVLLKMLFLLKKKGLIYFSTTVHDQPNEGYEIKNDYQKKLKRFRKRWTRRELNKFLESMKEIKVVEQYLLPGAFNKTWVNTIIKRSINA